MTRDRYKTVTEFALLVPASPSEAMGEATFSSEAFGPSHVRAFRLEEVKKEGKNLKGIEAERFGCLLSLRGALESHDQLLLDRGKERMDKLYRLLQAEAPKNLNPDLYREMGDALASTVGLSPEETAKYIFGLRSGPKAERDLRRMFSREVSEAVSQPLHNAQVVLWWFNGEFRPAIYCPDAKTALYVHTFLLAPAGGLGFRICPYDGEQFFQDRPNQEYCCPAHREAHRVARYRDNKKRKAAESGKKVKHHVPKKAR